MNRRGLHELVWDILQMSLFVESSRRTVGPPNIAPDPAEHRWRLAQFHLIVFVHSLPILEIGLDEVGIVVGRGLY